MLLHLFRGQCRFLVWTCPARMKAWPSIKSCKLSLVSPVPYPVRREEVLFFFFSAWVLLKEPKGWRTYFILCNSSNFMFLFVESITPFGCIKGCQRRNALRLLCWIYCPWTLRKLPPYNFLRFSIREKSRRKTTLGPLTKLTRTDEFKLVFLVCDATKPLHIYIQRDGSYEAPILRGHYVKRGLSITDSDHQYQGYKFEAP